MADLKKIMAEEKAKRDYAIALKKATEEAAEKFRAEVIAEIGDISGLKLAGDYGRAVSIEPLDTKSGAIKQKLGSRIAPEYLTVLINGRSCKVYVERRYPYDSSAPIYEGTDPKVAAFKFLHELVKHAVIED